MAQQCPASAGLSLSNAECSGPLPPPVGSLTYQNDFRPGGTPERGLPPTIATQYGLGQGADESINRPGRNSI